MNINLRPVETCLLVNNGWVFRKHLYKYIIINLVLEGALKVIKKRRKASPHPQSAYTISIYLQLGDQYQSSKLTSYEKEFLTFFKNEKHRFLIQQYGKLVREKFESETELRSQIANEAKSSYFTSSFFKSFKLTSEGKRYSKEVEKYLEKTESLLTSNKTSKEEKTKHINLLGKNIILLEEFDLKELKHMFTTVTMASNINSIDFESIADFSFTAIESIGDFGDFGGGSSCSSGDCSSGCSSGCGSSE